MNFYLHNLIGTKVKLLMKCLNLRNFCQMFSLNKNHSPFTSLNQISLLLINTKNKIVIFSTNLTEIILLFVQISNFKSKSQSLFSFTTHEKKSSKTRLNPFLDIRPCFSLLFEVILFHAIKCLLF
jgi:hypothetical protein